MAQTISQRLGEFISDLGYEKLPADVVRTAKLCVLDWLGSAIGGGSSRPVRMVADVVRALGGHPQATGIPDGSKTSCHLAALLNAASSHVLDSTTSISPTPADRRPTPVNRQSSMGFPVTCPSRCNH